LYNGKKKRRDYSSSGEDNLQITAQSGMPLGTYKHNTPLIIQVGVENILDQSSWN
jgi:hemoglobin/transferrin/lactoferrin receptor protein